MSLKKGLYGNPRDCPIREKNPTKIFRETQTKPFTLSQIVQSEIFLYTEATLAKMSFSILLAILYA